MESSTSAALAHCLDSFIAKMAEKSLDTSEDGMHRRHQGKVLLFLDIVNHFVVEVKDLSHGQLDDKKVSEIVEETLLVSLVVDKLSFNHNTVGVFLVLKLGPNKCVPGGYQNCFR